MTEKRSQLVIPINPQTLFTTLLSAAVIGVMTYVWITIPGQIRELKENDVTSIKESVIRIEAAQENSNRQIHDMLGQVKTNNNAVREIQDSRFSDRDADRLSKAITTDIKLELTPWFQDVNALKKDIDVIQKKLDEISVDVNGLKNGKGH